MGKKAGDAVAARAYRAGRGRPLESRGTGRGHTCPCPVRGRAHAASYAAETGVRDERLEQPLALTRTPSPVSSARPCLAPPCPGVFRRGWGWIFPTPKRKFF